jgi:RNA polymerase sigma factor (sigma-70 family)
MDKPTLSANAERLLAQRLCAGDESALGDAYRQFSSFVFSLALRVIGDRSAAEDITQDVFVGLWNQPERFDANRGSLRSYLGTLTHRRAVDLIRREEARRRRETKTSHEPVATAAVDDLALVGLTADTVRAAVASLPDPQRQAVELAYFGGHTYRQVADSLGIPEGTAKSRLRLALARIAETVSTELSEQWA